MTAQDGPKIAPRQPKTSQDAPKTAQDEPQNLKNLSRIIPQLPGLLYVMRPGLLYVIVWDLLRGGGREDPTVCGVEEGFSKLFGGSRSK